MVQAKKSNYSKRRGSHTYGYGSKKKQRGKGNIGGSGASGHGKRSASKKPSYQAKGYLGKHGFVNNNPSPISVINLKLIEDNFDNLIFKELIVEKDGFFEINLTEMGFDKLLGNCEVNRKYKITVKSTSKKSKERIESAGGEIVN